MTETRAGASASRLRDPLEMINSVSQCKLKADPAPDMAQIAEVARVCLRHHPTLARSTWLEALRMIRESLEVMEDIYDTD